MDSNEMLNLWGNNIESLKSGGILSTNGRVLLAIIYDNQITQIAISVTLNLSESAIEKSVAFWKNAGIIDARKIGRQNVYTINFEALHTHPDFAIMKALIENENQIQLKVT
jgi:predicted transcriptional regulator